VPVAAGTEWVGGRVVSPFFVMEGGPYRPEIVFWVEPPEHVVVGMQILGADGPRPSFAETLLEAMRRPLVGTPRRPERVRVGDLALAAELRSTFGDGMPVRIAPTPEIDDVLAHMAASFDAGRDHATYLEGGRIPAAAVAELFQAARLLWNVAPWKTMTDDQVLRVDASGLGIERACLSVIGNLSQDFGFLLFPSFEGYEAFLDTPDPSTGEPLGDLGTTFLSLNFERAADLPPGMRREVERHRWPVAGARAYPVVQHRERDGIARPLTERDVRIATACASALAAPFRRRRTIPDEEATET
jgi:hypothetical protein